MYKLKSKKTGDIWYVYKCADYRYAIAKWVYSRGEIDRYLIK